MMTHRGKLQTLFLFLFIFPLAAQISSVTSEGYLRDWQYDGDHVLYSTENGNVTSVITSDDERLVLRKYDSKHRLTSEVVWASGYETIVSETEWTYPETGVFPESMTKKRSEQKQQVSVLYSASGYETERTVFSLEEDGTAGNPLEKTSWQYDSENRVICKIHQKYTASGEEPSDGKSALIEKTEYMYTDKTKEPDMMYYENDVLVEKIEHSSDGMYTDSLFFENMEIRIIWSDGIKIDEVYLLDGKEIKRKAQ